MGFFSNIFKKIKKAIKKPLSKIFKGVGKGIAKVAKNTPPFQLSSKYYMQMIHWVTVIHRN